MRVPYLPGRAHLPQPSLGGGVLRYRPILAVRITGPTGWVLLDGVLDTGADDVIFPDTVAPHLGLDLSQAERRDVGLVGRKAVACDYAPVELLITDGISETYRWTAVLGFVASTLLTRPLLGYASFLQYFDAEFRGDDRAVILTRNRSFPGTGP
jgi:hypothetical protein